MVGADAAEAFSRLPQLQNTTLTFSLKPGVLLTSAGVMVPPLKRPMCENVSRFFRVIDLVSIPPMERPAMARWG